MLYFLFVSWQILLQEVIRLFYYPFAYRLATFFPAFVITVRRKGVPKCIEMQTEMEV